MDREHALIGGAAAGDLVVGLPDGREVAAGLAGRLGRDLLFVDSSQDAAEALARPARSAIVAGGATLTTADLRTMATAAARTGVGLGFVYGWAGDQVAAANADVLAASGTPLPESVLVWSAFAGLPAHQGGSPPVTVLAPDSPRVVDELTAGHRLVCMETHGNGVDAPLSDGRQLCARRAAPGAHATRASLPCLHGGPCIRVADGVADPDLQLSPTELRADVLVWATCWGLLAADSAFDPATSIARHLAEAGRVRATLTTLTSVRAAPARLLSIAALLAEGRTVGQVATELNRAEQGGATAPWVVIGDPLHAAFGRVPPDPRSVRPGLFRLPQPARAPAVTLSAEDGSTPGAFLTCWPELGDAVGLYRGRHPVELAVRAVAPDDEHLTALRALWRPRPGLAFVAAFMRWARTTSYLGDAPDTADLERDVELALARQEQLTAHPHPYTLLSGTPSKLPRLYERERRSWRALLERVAGYFHDFVTDSAGVLTHVYARYGLSTSASWPDPCPYCGGWTSVDEYRLPTAGANRSAVHCVVCANIADLGPGLTAATVTGPDELVAGRTTDYTVEVRTSGPHGSPVALARLAMQRVPFGLGTTTARVELAAVDEHLLAARAALRVGSGTPPGQYFLIAMAVVDGDVTLGRRPVTVTTRET